MAQDDRNGLPPFSKARTIGGLLLLGTVVVLSLIDAFSTDFSMEPIETGLILGTALLLLGVEGARWLIR